MAGERLPLSALLSQALVAFTIELDNTAEERLPHTTTDHGRMPGDGPRPWLTSYVMWANFLRFVPDDGIRVRDLARCPGVPRWAVDGMRRWGYVTIKPDPEDERERPPRGEFVVRPRRGGMAAAALWLELPGEIELRWRARFGEAAVDALGGALQAIVEQLPEGLPHYLPGVGYMGEVEAKWDVSAPRAAGFDVDGLDLAALLSQPLLAFTLGYDSGAKVPLSIAANVTRVLDDREPCRLRELPARSGIARESLDVLLRRLFKRGIVALEPDPMAVRGKVVRLTASGMRVRAGYPVRCAGVEARWRARFGERAVAELRGAHEGIVCGGALWEGLTPPPGGWRASVARPDTLPHYPLITHRGGYPDGS